MLDKIKIYIIKVCLFMAKEKASKNQKSMEETLWESANKLRGSVESSEYKHIVLGLIF